MSMDRDQDDAVILDTGNCGNCGRRLPDGHPVGDYCEKCPPHLCATCGEMDSIQDSCKCWVDVADIPHADLKAMLANDDLGLTTDGQVTHDPAS